MATDLPSATVQEAMQISGNATGMAYDVAIATKVNQSTREQGRQALELIQAATAPTSSPSSSVGKRLNVVA
jgi:hypothetical protein